MRWLIGVGVALAAALAMAAGCATPVETESDDGGGAATGTGGSDGGMGGASSSSSSMSECPIDCSTIMVDQCFESVCNPTTKNCEIVPLAAGTDCDDEQFCTLNDACDGNGDCVGPEVNDCGMSGTACEDVVCNEATLGCDLVAKDSGTPCTGPDMCLVNTTCQNGLCIGGTPKDCFFAPVPNECHVAVCNPATGICDPVVGNEGQGCTDPMDLCTVGKTCSNGMCVGGGPKDCSGLTEGCVDGVCDIATGNCTTQPIPANQPCGSGTDACNSGICDSMGQCISSPVNMGMMCDDGLSCTSGETCDGNGGCQTGSSATTIYLYETFANNNAGWTLGTSWQIGAATASTGEMFGGPDPASDTTPSYDDGVAGVVIGGNAPLTVHPYYYLQSPVVNTAGATTLVLEFERWLNSSIPGFANDVIEVFDGTSWQTVYSTAMLPMGPTDMSWQHTAIDISTYANANMQVRFGYDDTIGIITVSSWNIDDVVIASVACN